jgi:tetratricopeptide (TPR) repeat protein
VDKYLPVMAEGIEKVLCLAERNYLTRNLTEAMNLYESIENEYENSFFLNIRKAKILNFMGRPGDGLKLLEVIGVRNEKAVNSLTSGEWYLTRAMIGEGVLSHEEWLRCLNEAMSFFQKCGAELYQARTMNLKAIVLWYENRTDQVLEILDFCAEIFEKTEDMRNLTICLNFRANIFLHRREYSQATFMVEKAIEICNRYALFEMLIICHNTKADILCFSGSPRKAEAHHQIAIDYAKKAGPAAQVGFCFYQRALYYLREERFTESLSDLDFFESFADERQDLRLQTFAFYGKMKLAEMWDDYKPEKDYTLLFTKAMHELPDYVQRSLNRSISLFEQKYFSPNEKKCLIVTHEGSSLLSLSEIPPRENSGYQVYGDFARQKIEINGKELSFFHQNILVSILKMLVLRYPRVLNSREIFEHIWKTAYKPEEDGVVRANIYRLRKIFGNINGQQLIYSPFRGGHTLNNQILFCFIFSHHAK